MIVVRVVPYLGLGQTAKELNDWKNYDWDAQSEVRLEAGMFPNLIIGSIWVDGLYGEYPRYREYTCRIRVPEAKLSVYAPWEKLSGVSIVPKSVCPLPGGSLQSKMLMLRVTGRHDYLILPCSEAFRFYYGSSSKLATMLLDATWITEPWQVVGRRSNIDPTTRKAFLEIGPYHDNSDHVDIAQMYFGAIAGRESRDLVTRSLGNLRRREYPLAIGLPFDGAVEVAVRGVEYAIGKKKAILAYQIVTSRHRYPWSELEYGRATGSGSESAEAGSNAAFRRTSSIASGESVKVVQGANPGANELSYDLASTLSPNRYLTPPKATYVERKGDRSGARQYETVAASATHFAMGTGMRGSSLRRAALVSGEERGTPHRFELFIAAMHELESVVDGGAVLHDVYDLPNPRGGDDLDDGAQFFDRSITRWAFMDGHHRQLPRRVVIARLTFKGTRLIIFDIEPRDKKIRSDDPAGEKASLRILRVPRPQAISDDEIIGQLRAAIVDARGLVGGPAWKDSRFGSWRSAKLWHIATEDPKSYAERMVREIETGLA